MTVAVTFADRADKDDWNGFVAGCSDASFFHQFEWQEILSGCFPYRNRALIARENGHVVGVLPLMSMHGPFTGKALISNPLCAEAGPLAATDDNVRALVGQAASLSRDEGARYLELRGGIDAEPELDAENGRVWITSGQFSFFGRDLPEDPDEVMNAIPSRQRYLVRRALGHGLRAEADGDLNGFYELFCRTVRGHGTPPYPKRYFQAVIEAFPDSIEILSVRGPQGPVCAAFCLVTDKDVTPYYVGAMPEVRRNGGFQFMYHEMMRRAVERGIPRAELGRSINGSGSFAFKKNYGFMARPANYRFLVRGEQDLPTLDPDNPKLKPLLAVWRKLPLPLTVLIGNRLAWMAP